MILIDFHYLCLICFINFHQISVDLYVFVSIFDDFYPDLEVFEKVGARFHHGPYSETYIKKKLRGSGRPGGVLRAWGSLDLG